MAGIAIHSDNLMQQSSAVRNKTMKSAVPRRVLGDIKNTKGSISDSVEKSSLKPKKLLRTQTPIVNKKILFHVDKPSTAATPAMKPMNRLKNTQTPSFKIYADRNATDDFVATSTLIGPLREDDSEFITKEYMPPCTDKDFEIPLPDYVEKVCKSSPADLFRSFHSRNYLDDTHPSQRINKDLDDSSIMKLVELPTQFTEKFDESSLLFEPDDSFSLSALEEELRAAQLDFPDWLVDDPL